MQGQSVACASLHKPMHLIPPMAMPAYLISGPSVCSPGLIPSCTSYLMQRSFTGHRHYVQGVTWDPLGEHILTQSTDRTMRVHRARASKKRARAPASDLLAAADFVQASSVYKRALLSTETSAPSRAASSPAGTQSGSTPAAASPAAVVQCPQDSSRQQQPSVPSPRERPPAHRQAAARTTYIFQDECLNTFFRRLSFSPEGSFVVAPAATMGPLAQVSQYAAPIQACTRPRLACWSPPYLHAHKCGLIKLQHRLSKWMAQRWVRERLEVVPAAVLKQRCRHCCSMALARVLDKQSGMLCAHAHHATIPFRIPGNPCCVTSLVSCKWLELLCESAVSCSLQGWTAP